MGEIHARSGVFPGDSADRGRVTLPSEGRAGVTPGPARRDRAPPAVFRAGRTGPFWQGGGMDLDELIKRLDLDRRPALLAGQDFWSLPAIGEIGLRSLVMSDGPIGVRGTGWAPDDPSIALPSPTALAARLGSASWPRTAGRLLGQEARRKGVHVLLGADGQPAPHPARRPAFRVLLGGSAAHRRDRGRFRARRAGARGRHDGQALRGQRLRDRPDTRSTCKIDERALRELYLAPFERVVEAGGVGRDERLQLRSTGRR